MKNKIRVVVWGLGVMGSGIATMVLSKAGFTIVGAIDMDPNKVGKKLYEAGVDILVAGSFVFGANDPIETIADLKKL